MNFRFAKFEDIGDIKNLRLQMLSEFTKTLPDDLDDRIQAYLEEHILDGSCLCAVLEIQGQIVAVAMLCVYDEIPDEINTNGKCAKLCSVYTLPAFRGRGYMEALLRYLLEEAKSCGIREISAAAERKAMPLYEKIGFQTAETIMYMDL